MAGRCRPSGGSSIYGEETLKFKIEATPAGGSKAIKTETSQRFFTK
jgi:hypothetical protein